MAVDELKKFLAASLGDVVQPAAAETGAARTRRRVVVGLTLVVGAVGLGLALAVRPGDPLFYPATLGVAVVWVVGALASGPLHFGRARTRSGETSSRGILQGLILGGMLLGLFALGALVVARIPLLSGPVEDLLDHARFGALWLVALVTAVNGVAEELFFRGAAYEALSSRWRLPGTTALYASSTLLIGVPLLTLAAVCLGLLTAAQRRVTGGVAGPIASHLTWSLGMLFLLPPILYPGA